MFATRKSTDSPARMQTYIYKYIISWVLVNELLIKTVFYNKEKKRVDENSYHFDIVRVSEGRILNTYDCIEFKLSSVFFKFLL